MNGSQNSDDKQNRRTLKMFHTSWHARAIRKLQNLIHDERFLQDVETVRSWGEGRLAEGVVGLIQKYNAPTSCYELFGEYVRTGNINHFQMRFPVIVVSTKEGTAGPSLIMNNGDVMKRRLDEQHAAAPNERVYLELDPECTQTDLIEFIENWWSPYIQERLEKIKQTPVKRVKRRDYVERDEDIYKHIRVWKKPARAMAEKYGITEEYARQIASDFERRK